MADDSKHAGCGCGHKQGAHELTKRPVAIKAEIQAYCCRDSQATDAASGHSCCCGDEHGDPDHAHNRSGHGSRAASGAD